MGKGVSWLKTIFEEDGLEIREDILKNISEGKEIEICNKYEYCIYGVFNLIDECYYRLTAAFKIHKRKVVSYWVFTWEDEKTLHCAERYTVRKRVNILLTNRYQEEYKKVDPEMYAVFGNKECSLYLPTFGISRFSTSGPVDNKGIDEDLFLLVENIITNPDGSVHSVFQIRDFYNSKVVTILDKNYYIMSSFSLNEPTLEGKIKCGRHYIDDMLNTFLYKDDNYAKFLSKLRGYKNSSLVPSTIKNITIDDIRHKHDINIFGFIINQPIYLGTTVESNPNKEMDVFLSTNNKEPLPQSIVLGFNTIGNLQYFAADGVSEGYAPTNLNLTLGF